MMATSKTSEDLIILQGFSQLSRHQQYGILESSMRFIVNEYVYQLCLMLEPVMHHDPLLVTKAIFHSSHSSSQQIIDQLTLKELSDILVDDVLATSQMKILEESVDKADDKIKQKSLSFLENGIRKPITRWKKPAPKRLYEFVSADAEYEVIKTMLTKLFNCLSQSGCFCLFVHLLRHCDYSLLRDILHQLTNKVDAGKCYIDQLPDVLLLEIFLRVDVNTIPSVAKVCKKWKAMVSDMEFWKMKCVRKWPLQSKKLQWKFYTPNGEQDWYGLYRFLAESDLNKMGQFQQKGGVTVQELERLSQKRMAKRFISMNRHRTIGISPISQVTTPSLRSRLATASVDRVATPDFEEMLDRRPLMRPLLGKLNRFQEMEEFAYDVRPPLVPLEDVQGHVRPAEQLAWKSDIDPEESNAVLFGVIQPVKACRRLMGHLDSVTCLQFDSLRIVTGSADRSLRLWELQTGRSIHKFYGHLGAIKCLHFFDNQLASGSWDMRVMVWSLQPHFRRIVVLNGHTDVVSGVKVDKDFLLSASYDGTIRVYATISHYLKRVIILPCGIEAFHCDNANEVITAHFDRIIRVSHILTGTLLRQLVGQNDVISCFHVSGDLVMTGSKLGYLNFWNKATGAHICCVNGTSSNVSSTKNTLKQESKLSLSLPAATSSLTESVFNTTVRQVAITCMSYKNKYLWTGHSDGTIKEWALKHMTCVRTMMGHKGPVTQIQVSSTCLATSSTDASCRVWQFKPHSPAKLSTTGSHTSPSPSRATCPLRIQSHKVASQNAQNLRDVDLLRPTLILPRRKTAGALQNRMSSIL